MEKIKNVMPIPNWFYTIGELPTSFMESMTYQEQLLWLYNYLNTTIINTFNEIITKFNTMDDDFTTLQNNFNTLNTNVTNFENTMTQDFQTAITTLNTNLANGLTAIETSLSAQLPQLAENVISAKIQAGELNCQLGTSYNDSTEELTFTIQIVEGD